MKKDLDHILKQALTPQEEPDAWLDQNILYRAEEMANMKKKKKNQNSRGGRSGSVYTGDRFGSSGGGSQIPVSGADRPGA